MLLYMCNCQRSKQKRDVNCAFCIYFQIIHERIEQVPQTHPNYNCQKQTFSTNHNFFIVCKLHGKLYSFIYLACEFQFAV